MKPVKAQTKIMANVKLIKILFDNLLNSKKVAKRLIAKKLVNKK